MFRILVLAFNSKKDCIMDEENVAVPQELAALLDHYPISTFNLYVPELERVINVLERGLRMNFREVTVDWIECPNLRECGFVAPGPGKVFKITARYRTGLLDFVSAIQILLPLMRNEGDPAWIGLDGIILVLGIPMLHHVTPPSYSSTNLYTMNQVQQWLKYRRVFDPMIAVGTIMSEDGYHTSSICPDVGSMEYFVFQVSWKSSLTNVHDCSLVFFSVTTVLPSRISIRACLAGVAVICILIA
ncbi:hypothetical protein DMN91_011876 [Ooceraea biroi]|uniref:DUF1907 domain-containing protein n=1 Tax=Ooceraea biroi TaxID=2015173 RepID=A0A3L8D6M2_OOCBI|nr:hypothetical protein DMN91_011876 [Ooceraea biroi]